MGLGRRLGWMVDRPNAHPGGEGTFVKRPFSKKNLISQTLQSSFEYHVYPEPNSGCFLWGGPIFGLRGGYGVFTSRPFGIIMQRAHRVAWKIYCGDITRDQHVLHKCDNPLCVNVDHLWLGNQADNMRDKAMKGRQRPGVLHGMYKHGRYIGDKQNPIYHRAQTARVHP